MARTIRTYKKHEVIILEGSQGNQVFHILSGEVDICRETIYQTLMPITKLCKGEYFGEMFLFDPDGKRNATAIAGSDDLILEIIPEEEIKTLLDTSKKVQQELMRGMAKKLKDITEIYSEKQQISS